LGLDRPRRHNLWLPAILQYLYYLGGGKNELHIASLRDNGFNFDEWIRGHRRYMSCYDEFGKFPDKCYAELFHPNRKVMEIVNAYESLFSNYTIGMHIRRTDNIDSIQQSPTELFVEAGRREQAEHPNLTIFLATDSEEVKRHMRQEFGDRVITSTHEASRDSVQGIREGLADMWISHVLTASTALQAAASRSWHQESAVIIYIFAINNPAISHIVITPCHLPYSACYGIADLAEIPVA